LSRVKKRQRHQSLQQKTLYCRPSSSEATTPSFNLLKNKSFSKARGALRSYSIFTGHQDEANHSCRSIQKIPALTRPDEPANRQRSVYHGAALPISAAFRLRYVDGLMRDLGSHHGTWPSST
jgi:hypothetical protein